MRSGGLFAGYGGLDMAVAEVFGAEPAWFSEIEDAPSKILAHHWPDVPNLGDITKIDWDTVEPVDIVSGGFPCQDVSAAGKRAGMHPDTRSGLWDHMAYAISKLRPRYVVAENVRGLLSAEAHSDVEPCPWCLGDGPGEPALRALGAVLGDLADLGYNAQWCGLRAADVGAPHGRYRVFILAADTRCDTGQPWRVAAPGETSSWRAHGVSAGRSGACADRDTDGHDAAAVEGLPCRSAVEPGRVGGVAAADPDRYGFGGESWTPTGRDEVRADERDDADRRGMVDWGPYGPAVERWERILGRVAPSPTEPNIKGSQRLNPAFVEWMMGLPAGHVTAVPGVNRNAQLKALGNGVVPQQAIAALRHMYAVAERREVA
jgi:DNA (cytosine-5)-methyltransferase 1